MKKYTPLDAELKILHEKAKKPFLTIEQILHTLSGKGRLLMIILCSLPFCQPIMLPGMSTPFGILIIFLGLRLLFEKRIWLPKALLTKKIKGSHIRKMAYRGQKVMKKLQRFLHPRLTVLSRHTAMHWLNGISIIFLGFLLSLPLPIPFSNLAIAWPLLLLSLGMLEDDGVFILVSYIILILGLSVLIFLAFTATHLLKFAF